MSQFKANQKEYHVRKLLAHFKLIDGDNTGCITRRDFIEMAEKLKALPRMSQREENLQAVDMAFQAIANILNLEEGVNYTPLKILPQHPVNRCCQKVKRKREQSQITSTMLSLTLLMPMEMATLRYRNIKRISMFWAIIFLTKKSQNRSMPWIATKTKKISRQEFLEAAFDFFFNVDESEVANVFLGYL